jgi:hypothetical protein
MVESLTHTATSQQKPDSLSVGGVQEIPKAATGTQTSTLRRNQAAIAKLKKKERLDLGLTRASQQAKSTPSNNLSKDEQVQTPSNRIRIHRIRIHCSLPCSHIVNTGIHVNGIHILVQQIARAKRVSKGSCQARRMSLRPLQRWAVGMTAIPLSVMKDTVNMHAFTEHHLAILLVYCYVAECARTRRHMNVDKAKPSPTLSGEIEDQERCYSWPPRCTLRWRSS